MSSWLLNSSRVSAMLKPLRVTYLICLIWRRSQVSSSWEVMIIFHLPMWTLLPFIVNLRHILSTTFKSPSLWSKPTTSSMTSSLCLSVKFLLSSSNSSIRRSKLCVNESWIFCLLQKSLMLATRADRDEPSRKMDRDVLSVCFCSSSGTIHVFPIPDKPVIY